MQRWFLPSLAPIALLLCGCETLPQSGHLDGKPFFTENFSQTTTLPEGWLALNGKMAITNATLQLPAEPLEPHGVMFGPAFADGLRVAAKFRAEKKGRQSPTFSLGLNGVSGYRLRVNPAKKKLELLRNDVVVNETNFQWTPAEWTHLALQIRPLPGLQWVIEGSAWTTPPPGPGEWQLAWKEVDKPLAGRPSAWATPFAGKPIEVDNLRLWRID